MSRTKSDDAETIVVAGAIADRRLARTAIDGGIVARHFRARDAKRAWEHLLAADGNGEHLSGDALASLFRQDGEDGDPSLYARAAARWPGSTELFDRALADILAADRIRSARSLAAKGLATLDDAAGEQDFAKAAESFSGAADFASGAAARPIHDSGQVAGLLIERLATPPTRLQTGIQKLDHALGGGLETKRVVSISGKYKIGKTTLLTTIGYNVAYGKGEKDPDNTARVLFVSLERNQIDIEMLAMARSLGVNMADLEDDFSRLSGKMAAYRDDAKRADILYYHDPGADMEVISGVVRRAVRQHGVRLVLIDYYQIIGRQASTRLVEHLMSVDQTLARLADGLDIAIVVAAQADADGLPRDSKSLLHSAAANFSIRRQDDSPEAWLDNLACNYRRQRDAGSPTNPAMRLDDEVGPHFASI